MTLFRTSVTRAGVKYLCCNYVKNNVFVHYIACMIITLHLYLNVASHKFVFCYILNIFFNYSVLKHYKTIKLVNV